MHFSVGQFTEEYLQQAPIGIMKNEEGKVIAFCTLMPTYYNEAISVDLIRWLPDLDLPLMDAYIYICYFGVKIKAIKHLTWVWQLYQM